VSFEMRQTTLALYVIKIRRSENSTPYLPTSIKVRSHVQLHHYVDQQWEEGQTEQVTKSVFRVGATYTRGNGQLISFQVRITLHRFYFRAPSLRRITCASIDTINRAANSAREMLHESQRGVTHPNQTEPTRRSYNYNVLITLRHRHGNLIP
jgi:hypothetical protein